MNAGTKMILIGATILVVAAAAAVIQSQPNISGNETDFFVPIEKTGVPVIVVSDSVDLETVASYLEDCSDNVVLQNNMPLNFTRSIIIIDSEWAVSKSDLKVKEALASGAVVLYWGGSPEAFDGERTGLGRSAFLEGASMYGMYHYQPSDAVYCYSAVADDPKETFERSYVWADQTAFGGQRGPYIWQSTYPEWQHPGNTTACFDVECGGYGWMRGMTTYFSVHPESAPFVYGAHFRLQSMPYLGKATAEAYVGSRGEYQAQYNPLSTFGQETIWVSSISGLSWSYKGYGIIVHNKSDMSKDMMRLEHDIDESKRFEYPIVIEPERLSYVYYNDYTGEDTYGILFCERTSTFGSEWEWFEVKCNVSLERSG
ncbi:MAG: hypothetical protein LBB30_01470 [Candidatus Methanoplasma sp.]|jgi:hypothetical protein|nr:hypothetical protein [Candidatus Methanoplasma sp.]